MKRIWILPLFLVLAGCRPALRTSHDVIYLASGEELNGSLDRITSDSVWFTTSDDGKLAFDRSQVTSVDLPQPRPGEEWKTVKDVNDPLLREIFAKFVPPETDVKYINVYVEHNYILRADGSFEKRTRVIRYVSAESGKGEAANNTWSYLADRAYAKLDFARSFSPEGKVTHITESAINRTSLYPAPAEYSNLMQIQIAVPESRVGSLLDFQFSTVQNVTDSLHPVSEEIVLDERQPTLMEVIRVEQPESGPLSVYTTYDAPAKREVARGQEILTWTIENQPPMRIERMTPPSADYLPRFIIAKKEDWYAVSSHLKGSVELAAAPGEGLAAVADSLTKGLSSSEDKARALYRFVATSIRPAGPSLDNYSYVPTPAETVLVRRFANNLDRAVLLYALMLEAGLEADLLYTRTRFTGRLVPTFPALGQLNYALVLFEDRIWLDPRPSVRFGTLMEQDAMGLSVSSGKLKKTPLLGPTSDEVLTRNQTRLAADGTLDLTTTVSFNGKTSASWKAYLKDLSPAELRQEAEELAAYVNPNASLISYEFRGIEPLEADVGYTLRIRMPRYATLAGDYMIFYLPGIQHSAYQVGATERLYPIDRVTRSQDVTNMRLELPAGATLIYYPEDVSLSTNQDSYSANFVIPGRGTLEFNESVQVKEPWIAPGDYPDYKSLVEGMARLSQEPIVLKLR